MADDGRRQRVLGRGVVATWHWASHAPNVVMACRDDMPTLCFILASASFISTVRTSRH